MIPTIKDIVAGVADGTYTQEQAVEWLNVYANTDGLQDMYAGQALTGLLSNPTHTRPTQTLVIQAHTIGRQMVEARRIA
jgi:hypothetical protein